MKLPVPKKLRSVFLAVAAFATTSSCAPAIYNQRPIFHKPARTAPAETVVTTGPVYNEPILRPSGFSISIGQRYHGPYYSPRITYGPRTTFILPQYGLPLYTTPFCATPYTDLYLFNRPYNLRPLYQPYHYRPYSLRPLYHSPYIYRRPYSNWLNPYRNPYGSYRTPRTYTPPYIINNYYYNDSYYAPRHSAPARVTTPRRSVNRTRNVTPRTRNVAPQTRGAAPAQRIRPEQNRPRQTTDRTQYRVRPHSNDNTRTRGAGIQRDNTRSRRVESAHPVTTRPVTTRAATTRAATTRPTTTRSQTRATPQSRQFNNSGQRAQNIKPRHNDRSRSSVRPAGNNGSSRSAAPARATQQRGRHR